MTSQRMADWHGWKLADGEALHVGTMPGRKRPVLYLSVSNEFCAQLVPVASFRDEDAAKMVLDWLDRAMGKR